MQTQRNREDRFLHGGGEMGAHMRAYDWAATPLGAPADWPQALKTALRLLLSSGHPMLIWWGPELIQFYNDPYSRSLGPERHPGALGASGRECWAENWDIVGPQIEQVMSGGHTWHENQLVPITRHGRREEAYWTYSCSPIDEPSAASGVGGVLVVCTETTDQVLAERRLQEADRRWRTLFAQTSGFVGILQGPEHVFEFANPRFHELVNGRELVGRTLSEAVPEMLQQGFVTLLDAVYSSGEPYRATAMPTFLVEGVSGQQRHYIDIGFQPIHGASGEVSGILVDGYDVTDRVVASTELRNVDRRKNEFLAMLAHELRNPLAPIRNASELLIRSATSDPATREIADLLERQVTQLSRLIDDLLDISRIKSGRIVLRKSPVELGQVIQMAVESVQPMAKEKGHLISVHCSEPMYVDGDISRLVQSVANIVNNAAKYTNAGGSISVTLTKESHGGVIEVTDSGVGISAEILPNIFELFIQDDRTLDRSQGGLGIGLSLALRLVRMHGGDILAHSGGPGRGATFKICLPLVEPPSAPDRREDRSAVKARRVLVVDDNVDAADSLADLLAISGHETLAVYSAEHALAHAQDADCDVVLLDIGLPEMDGYEVAKRIRAAGNLCRLIAVTGYGRPQDIEMAHEAGFDSHMTKPVDLDALLADLDSDLQA